MGGWLLLLYVYSCFKYGKRITGMGRYESPPMTTYVKMQGAWLGPWLTSYA